MSGVFGHESVLPDETIDHLNIDKNGKYIDCTAGGGGHSARILERLGGEGLLIAIDRDAAAVEETKRTLEKVETKGKYIVVKDNFLNIDNIIKQYIPGGADGILMDLGVSSHQLDQAERGFSYHSEAPLDMRMDTDDDLTAYDVVNGYTKEKLTEIIGRYGEERYAGRIASAIEYKRRTSKIRTTTELAEIIKSAYPPKDRFKGTHPARRTFQAIRIEVNKELEILEEAIYKAADGLRPGGRLAVISFHSLEDRIVKVAFSKLENPCTCPPYFPVCVCKRVSRHKVISKKPILPAGEEIDNNRRSRSSKLRIIECTMT
ncbi:MAG: 16S rRNA (cytosine(1402)-N(4))-methyltransferase RsmH [Clostridia bacterium]